MTLDQRSSRTQADAVPAMLNQLSDIATAVPFERTIGDEIQGVLHTGSAVMEALQLIVPQRTWYIGIGVGAVETPLPARSSEARGPAFIHAREAVEAAKSSPIPLLLQRADEQQQADTSHPYNRQSTPVITARDVETALQTHATLLTDPTKKQWRVIAARLAQPDATQTDLARQLGVSQQFVSATVRAGRAELIARSQQLCATLLDIIGDHHA